MDQTAALTALISAMLDDRHDASYIANTIIANAESMFPRPGVTLTDQEAAVVFVAARRYLGDGNVSTAGNSDFSLLNKLRDGYNRHNSCGAVR